jgi:hypothetical protein
VLLTRLFCLVCRQDSKAYVYITLKPHPHFFPRNGKLLSYFSVSVLSLRVAFGIETASNSRIFSKLAGSPPAQMRAEASPTFAIGHLPSVSRKPSSPAKNQFHGDC